MMQTQASLDASSRTILLAEDEAQLRLVVVETLEDAGYAVIEAADGDAGLAILRSDRQVDMLISDIKMPGLNGYQLAEAGLTLRPAIKVLLMTGYADEAIPAVIRQAAIRIIHKPFDFDDLSACVGEIIKSS
jgi:DNA-binding NtrC family response regulator